MQYVRQKNTQTRAYLGRRKGDITLSLLLFGLLFLAYITHLFIDKAYVS